MKLALLVALALDRRTGLVVSDILPADQAIKAVKKAVETGECPDARFPILQAVSIESRLREHRFRVSPEQVAEAGQVVEEGADWIDPSDLIKVELGDGEHAIVILVTTEVEAAFIRDLADSAAGAAGEIERLRGLLDEARTQAAGLSKANQRIADLEAEVAKAVADLATANQKQAAFETDLAKSIADLAASKDVISQREARIAELESPPNPPASKKGK